MESIIGTMYNHRNVHTIINSMVNGDMLIKMIDLYLNLNDANTLLKDIHNDIIMLRW